MTNPFANASSELAGSEKEKDILGGRSLLPTDVYDGKIEVAYLTKSEGGANAFNFVLNIAGKIIRETIYVSNREGGVTYSKDGKKYPLPGYSMVNAITQLTLGKKIPELTFEPKLVKIYDFDQKKEVAREMSVAVELTGRPVQLGIELLRENKRVKDQAGKYVPVADVRESNVIARVFHTDSGQTINEYETGTPAEFKGKWLAEFKGKPRDKTDKSLKASPGAPASTGTSTPAPAKSLFGGG